MTSLVDFELLVFFSRNMSSCFISPTKTETESFSSKGHWASRKEQNSFVIGWFCGYVEMTWWPFWWAELTMQMGGAE